VRRSGSSGHNGAGKSTLLRVVARTLKPNEGRVVVNGKMSTLLQLGVGFNPQLSGARNVYLGGLAAGMTRKQVDAVYDDIVEFAEIGDAIDRPMKTYSSGYVLPAGVLGQHAPRSRHPPARRGARGRR
jgi:teichoic acid transport system ATP-binding protein